MDKQILTWTNLCGMAARVAKHRPDDYSALVSTGTDRFLPGYYTQMIHDRVFRIFRSADGQGPLMMEIHGVFSDTGYFTKIKHNLTPTGYRKRFWDRHMPVSFPNGLPIRGASAPCVYHSVSGKKQYGGTVKFNKYRNEPGIFDVNCEVKNWFLINDTTGKLAHIHPSFNAAPSAGDAIELYPYDPQDRQTCRDFPWYRPATLADTLRGVQHGAVTSRDEWLKSIWRACEAGLMDKYKCLPLAARMWNAAYRFCQANKDKHAKMNAFPISLLSSSKAPRYGKACVLEYRNPRFVVVDGEQEAIPVNSQDSVQYRLPQLDIWWEGERDSDMGRNNPILIGSTRMDQRFVKMVLPPHGNPLLYEKPHYAAPYCRTAVSQSRMTGECAVASNGDPANVLSDNRLMVQFLERAYHGAPIYEPSRLGLVEGVHCRSRLYNQNTSWSAFDESKTPFAKWRDYEGCVLVQSNFDEAQHGKDGPWAEYTQSQSGMPATPESAVSMVEEAALIDSLPLS